MVGDPVCASQSSASDSSVCWRSTTQTTQHLTYSIHTNTGLRAAHNLHHHHNVCCARPPSFAFIRRNAFRSLIACSAASLRSDTHTVQARTLSLPLDSGECDRCHRSLKQCPLPSLRCPFPRRLNPSTKALLVNLARPPLQQWETQRAKSRPTRRALSR